MSEIEIGEYVRTKRGYILKYDDEHDKAFIDNFLVCEYMGEKIVKHSKNQKELIQEGDILQYQINKLSCTKIGKVRKYKDARSFKEYLGVEGFNLEQITILRILTKEKFEEESYKVGE